ncbi:ShlB/FhaC/HecB family hemolysin secretion/activation protein [Uliginosibacterium sp. H3]|uniref:ShlB/FhaC/HecB family hemolysin secretion/activation protein n=1 Tax=Uliginosibacterium silvisoli TaxID=3114758 RepID=A0ABU6K0N8_9RHOO|nr:ShlB/FhaC/HecB family hemolysin secretion/activation protein [Uliginosibacterium sp. H3]
MSPLRSISTPRKTQLASSLVAALAVLACASAAAQTTPAIPANAGGAADAAARLQREELERQRQQMERDQRALPAPRGSESTTPVPKQSDTDTVCRDIKEIVISGGTHLSESKRKELAAPYLKRCLFVRDIEKLVSDITTYYIRQGYVTTRAYIPKQDLSKGRLEILVVEGTVEKVSVQDGDKRSVSIGNVLPGLNGEILNIRDLEQGLDQINRLQSNNATFDIVPGEQAGGSTVLVKNTPASPFHASLSVDNEGSKATGKTQVGISASVDDVFGFNDFLSASYRQSVPEHDDSQLSRTESVAYILPLGYNTLSLAFSKSRYVTQITTASGYELQSSGRSTISSARFDRVIYRSSSERASLAGTLSTKSTRNYLDDQLLDVSSRNLTLFDADFNYTATVLGSLVSIDLGLSQGLKELDALEDPDYLPREAPRAQFLKYKYGASIALPFRVGNYDASFSSTLVGQQSRNALYGSEQILVGSIYTVRGFVDTNLSGDNGFYLRNDLGVRLPVSWAGNSSLSLRPYVGVDFGRTSMRYAGTDAPAGNLSGVAVGVSLNGRYGSFDIFTARPLSKPDFMPRESSSTFARLSLFI